MSVFINPKEDEYADSIKNNYVGFRALVHSPYDFAEVDAKGLSIGINEEKFIAIRAYTSFSTGYIKFYSIKFICTMVLSKWQYLSINFCRCCNWFTIRRQEMYTIWWKYQKLSKC